MIALKEIKYMAVALAALISFLLGFVWYGLLFGETWAAAAGVPMEQGQQQMLLPMMGEYVITFLRAFGIACIMKLAGNSDISGGFRTGIFVSIFFIITSQAGVWFWQGKLNLFLIDGSIQCISAIVMGMIIGFWEKVTQ